MKNSELIKIYKDIAIIEHDNPDIFKGNVKALYALIRNRKIINEEAKSYQEAYDEIANEFVANNKVEPVLDEEGNEVDKSIKQEYMVDWINAMTELGNIEVDISIHKISLDNLDNPSITLDILEKLEFMIDDAE